MADRPRWWWCRSCQAVNDGLETSQCWNCDTVQRKSKDFPWCEMGKERCKVCGTSYITWTLPAGAYLRDEKFTLGFCPFYFEHFGDNAYFPPMLPASYVLDANGYHYSERTKRPVKTRVKPTTKRATCPYCAKRVALTKTGLLHAHLDPETKERCVRRHPN